jgi:hypothetical protein
MSVSKRRGLSPASSFLLVALLFVASAYGQSVSVVRANSYEIDPFIGASYGLDSGRVMGGGNVTYAINKYILPYFEYSYFPGIPKRQTVNGTVFNYQIPISDIHGGVHIRLPIFRESPIVPYAVFGLGGLVTGKISGTQTFTNPNTGQPITVALAPQNGTSAFAINGGGGVRWYMGQRYGMRLEAKVYKGTSDLDQTFAKFEFGFFFQLH